MLRCLIFFAHTGMSPRVLKTDFYTAETSANGSSTAKDQFGKVKETVDKGLKDNIKLKYGKGTYKFELRLDGQSTAADSFTIEIE